MESAGVLSLCNNYGENSIGFYKLYIKVQRFCKSAEVLHFTLHKYDFKHILSQYLLFINLHCCDGRNVFVA